MNDNKQFKAATDKLALPIWRQLRWRLILSFIVLAAVPVIIAEGYTLTRVRGQATDQVVHQLESVVELKQAQVQSWLEQGNLALQIILSDETRHQQFVDHVTAATSDDAGAQSISSFLSAANNTHPYIRGVFLYDLDGRILAASDDTEVGKVVRRQPYFAESVLENSVPGQQLTAEADYKIHQPYYDLGIGELTLVVTHPVRDASGQIVAILAGRLNTDTLGQIMTERTGLGETGETYLVSVENNYLLTPSRHEGYPLTRAYHSVAIDNALSRKDGSGSYANYQAPTVNVIGSYRWIPEIQAGLIAEVSEDEALAAATDVLSASVVLTILAGMAAVVVALWTAAQISRPILSLARTAIRISSNDLSYRAKVHQRDEIGILAQSFNEMADELTEKIVTLDRQTTEIQEANKSLKIANARIKEEARLKSEFMSTMSHELRTPLNAIIGFTGIMLEGMGGEFDDEAAHMIERIESNSVRLLGLINEVLDLAKIESGRMELVQTQMKPATLARDWKLQMTSLADKKGLEFEVHVDPQLPETLYGDPERLTQVAINLLSNAFKFTQAGSVKLTVKQLASQWQLAVTDTGIGIPPHALNYIFDEFRQIDGSSTRVYGGSGLGLAIVRNIVLMMGGNVRVESTLGQGSTFTVTLPLKTELEEQALLETA